ncbi:20799_t:CDS:2, partial [Gigaspora margarita]
YHFDYNYGNLNESTLELLRLWPIDKQILQTIKHSHQLACELAEFLNIMPIDDFFISNFPQVFVVIYEKEVSTNMDNEIINFTNDKQDENNEISVSIAITEASCKMKHIITQNHNEEILSNNLFQDGSLQVNIVNRSIEDFSTLYNSDTYTSRPLDRKFNIKSVSTKFNINSTTIHPNKASHIVAYFSNNKNPEQRSVKQREKRWKKACKNMSNTLAQIHTKELVQTNKYKSIKKQNSFIQ